MEELQHCLQIAAQRDRGVVHSRRHVLGMEGIWIELPTMDPWETSVAGQRLLFRRG